MTQKKREREINPPYAQIAHLEEISNQAVVSHLENGRLWVLVDGYNGLGKEWEEEKKLVSHFCGTNVPKQVQGRTFTMASHWSQCATKEMKSKQLSEN